MKILQKKVFVLILMTCGFIAISYGGLNLIPKNPTECTTTVPQNPEINKISVPSFFYRTCYNKNVSACVEVEGYTYAGAGATLIVKLNNREVKRYRNITSGTCVTTTISTVPYLREQPVTWILEAYDFDGTRLFREIKSHCIVVVDDCGGGIVPGSN